MQGFSTRHAVLFFCLIAITRVADGDLLYNASLKNDDYGGGFRVGTYDSSRPWNRSGSTGGDLSTLGIVDSAVGATFTTPNDVINFSLGADGYNRAQFRTMGTVSVLFKADLADFGSGQPFTDNFGFDQFRSGQATFGTGLSRHAGVDRVAGTADDGVELSWNTWHNNVWYSHVDTANDEVLLGFDQWHHLGLTWGGPTNQFEVWVDGVLWASDNLPTGTVAAWGRSDSAYNFALGEIHERMYGKSSPFGIMFADLHIWDEYREHGDTAPVPEPGSVVLWSFVGVVAVGYVCRRRRSGGRVVS